MIRQGNEDREHPTQKPLGVMKWVIEFCPKANTILDPFMGSGTTGVAAIQMGCKFIGIEREPKYFDIACKRIEQAVAQGQLFEPEPTKEVQNCLLQQCSFFKRSQTRNPGEVQIKTPPCSCISNTRHYLSGIGFCTALSSS